MANTIPNSEMTIEARADPVRGRVDAVADLPADPARVFQSLASDEITSWWVRPGVFDTRVWRGDVRPGGKWQASGLGKMGPYGLEGEFIEISAPLRLVHSWKPAGAPVDPMIVTYELTPVPGATRVVLAQTGFQSAEVCAATAAGWETSFQRLAEILKQEHLAKTRTVPR